MFRKMIDWYDELEREQLAVLENPALAATVAPGWRRKAVDQLAAMPPLERQQLYDFCVAYQGRRLWTALVALVAGFTLAGLLAYAAFGKGSMLAAVFIANLFGFTLLVGGIGAWFNARKTFAQKHKLVLRAVLGALIGALAVFIVNLASDTASTAEALPRLPGMLAMAAMGGLTFAVPIVVISALARRQLAARMARLEQQAEKERLARELSDSQLRILRAQIEPHFLFNTLGAVQQLAADGAPRAAALTADLIAFLRASFDDLRSEQVSLATEFATVAAYLRVMQARMGARLDFSLDLPEALAPLRLPSMLVLTLVENAVKHGIEPALRGGAIHVAALEENGKTVVRVVDSGVGLGATPGQGAGLDNIRRRLALAYGEAASLDLYDAAPGVTAQLVLPPAAQAAQAAQSAPREAA